MIYATNENRGAPARATAANEATAPALYAAPPRQRNRAQRRADKASSRRAVSALDAHVAAVLAGRLDPAEAVRRTPYAMRHTVPLVLHRLDVAPDMLRPALAEVWSHNHLHLRLHAGRDEVLQMFAHAEFRRPPHLPAEFTAWRGTQGCTLAEAQSGLSWSTSREAAAWFSVATRNGQPALTPPLLIKRTVNLRDVLYATDHAGEAEVVVGAAPAGEVDGTPDEWCELAGRHLTDHRAGTVGSAAR